MRKEESRKRTEIRFMFTSVLVYLSTDLLKRRVRRLIHNPSLEENVHKEDRQKSQNGCGEYKSLVRRMLRLEPDEEKRNGAFFWRGQDD